MYSKFICIEVIHDDEIKTYFDIKRKGKEKYEKDEWRDKLFSSLNSGCNLRGCIFWNWIILDNISCQDLQLEYAHQILYISGFSCPKLKYFPFSFRYFETNALNEIDVHKDRNVLLWTKK